MRVGKRSAFKRIFSRYRSQIIVGVVVVIMTALMICSAMGVVNLPLFDVLARYTVVPIKNAFDTVGESIQILFEDTEEIETRLITLEKQNEQLRMENERIDELERENDRLRALVDFAQRGGAQYLGASVIAREPGSWFSAFTIDRGALDGVTKGMAVVTPDGLAGVVVQVQDRTASVRSIVDAYSSLAGLIERTRDQGIVNGLLSAGEGNQLEMVYLPEQADLSIGDRVLTTGMEGTYPKGLLVGTVSQILRRSDTSQGRVTIRPAVDFDHLEEVLVLVSTEGAQ